MFEIWVRKGRIYDICLTEEYEDLVFENVKKAKAFCDEETENHKDEGWKGHWLYGATFYPVER